MVPLVSFTTSRFDPTKEPRNPINPIQGESALRWLKNDVLPEEYESTDPDAEDWGWYIDVVGPDNSYMIGSIVHWEDDENPHKDLEWMFQIHKKRSLVEKLMGKNKMSPADKVLSLIVDSLKGDSSFSDITVEKDA